MKKAATIVLAVALVGLLLIMGRAQQPRSETESAEQLYNTGYLLTLLGYYENAIELFRRSLEIQITAEAHTYLGWTYAQMGDYARAIEEAQKAIRVDPEFGNPYNDIGVYLIEQGKEDEAIPYLEKATRAKRYCCYQLPYFNLGRIYLKKKMYDKARQGFEKSLEIDPDYLPAREGLELLAETGAKET
jgi:tetratricopeptide (TPR) repeat protein